MLTDLLIAAVYPVCQIGALVLVGLAFRVDRKRKGGA